jgi:hypothetical protein
MDSFALRSGALLVILQMTRFERASALLRPPRSEITFRGKIINAALEG